MTDYNAARADNSYSVVTIVGADATLDGLTITAGQGGTPGEPSPGGIGERQGAGLFAKAGIPRLKLNNCIFSGNNTTNNTTSTTAANLQGGAAYFGHDVMVSGCIFMDNMAKTGGAVYVDGGLADVKFANCTFMDNTAGFGGAVYEASIDGGTFESCFFSNNRATVGRGGALQSESVSLVTNTVFYNNTANTEGGGAYFSSGGTVINSTFYSNTSNNQGGGLFFRTNAIPSTLRNSLLIGNTAADNASGHQVYVDNTDAAHVVNLQNNLIAGGLTGTTAGIIYSTAGALDLREAGTVNASDVATVFASTDAMNADFLRLAVGSPAIGAGNNDYVDNAVPPITIDAAGRTRIVDGTVDLGAYESKATQTIMFTTPTATGAAGTEIALEATASSGLDVTFMITGGTGTATIADGTNTLRLTGIGTVEITATQAGNDDYAATTETQTIMVSQGTQVIAFTSDDAGAAGTDIELEATASSGLDVTFAINEEFETDGTTPATDASVATLADDGTTLSLIGVGTVEITATQAGNTSYTAATKMQTITVSQGTQVIAFTSDDAGAAGTDIELEATASSTLPVTYEITGEFEMDGTTPATDASVATLSGGNNLTLVGVGTVEITATQAGNTSYTATTETQTITVSQGMQTIAFTSDDTGDVGTDITLEATGGASGLPVTFMITGEFETDGTTRATDGTVATLSGGNNLTLVGVGKVEITATQAGNTSYTATTETQTITVSQGTQTIAFTSDDTGAAGTDIDLVATASSGLDVTFMITGEFETDGTTRATDGTVATLSGGNNLTLVGVGTVEITATQAGNTSYTAATQMQTITVSQGTQTLMFTSDGVGTINTEIELAATASSGLAVTFAVTTETLPDGSAATTGEVATLADNGTTLSLTGAGTATITATQAGNANYATATQTQTITVSAIPLISQTIAFSSPDTGTVGTPITLVATATSTGMVTFAITEVQDVDGNVVTNAAADAVTTLSGSTLTLRAAGTVTITASQAGGDIGGTIYAAATQTQEITIMPMVVVPPTTQTITFTSPTAGTVGTPITLVATATSTGTVTFAVTEVQDADGNVVTDAAADAVATLSGSTLTLLAAGTVTITASQAGGDIGGTIYAAATETQEITITAPSVVLGIEEDADGFVLYPNPTSGKLHFSEQVTEFRLYGIEGRLLETRKNVRSADLSARPVGLYFVEVVRGERSLRWRILRE